MKIFIVVHIAVFLIEVNSQHHREVVPTLNKYAPGSDVSAKTTYRDFSRHKDGSYNYEYETSNGISAKQTSIDGKSVQGSSHYTSPEGKEISLQYTADEFGYHPVGDHIPKIPDYILRALEYIRAHPYKTVDSSGNIVTATFAPHAFDVLDKQPAGSYQRREQRHQSENYQTEREQRRRRQQEQRQQEQQQQQQSQKQQQKYLRKREQQQFEEQKQFYKKQQFAPLFVRSADEGSPSYDHGFRNFF